MDLIKSVADTKSSRPDISKTSTRSIHRSLRVGITASKKERNSKNTGYEGKNVNTKTLFPRETASLPPSPHRGNAWKSGRPPPPSPFHVINVCPFIGLPFYLEPTLSECTTLLPHCNKHRLITLQYAAFSTVLLFSCRLLKICLQR